MKWMLSTTLAVAVGLAAAPRAQAGYGTGKPMKDDKMAPVTYTGCVESGPAGAFLLTHVDAGQHMAMKGDDMSKHDMTMAHEAGAANDMSKGGMKDDHMMSANVRLVGFSSVSKHVGQKVSVKGSASHEAAGMQGEPPAFTVTSLKVVSKSCS